MDYFFFGGGDYFSWYMTQITQASARAGMITVLRGRLVFTLQCQVGHEGLRRDFVWVGNLKAFSSARMCLFIVVALECYLVKGSLMYAMKTNSCTIKNDDDNDKNNIY